MFLNCPSEKQALISDILFNTEMSLRKAIDLTAKVMDATDGGIMFYRPERNELLLHYPAFSAPRELVSKYRVSLNSKGNAVRVFQSGQGYFTNQVRGDPNVLQRYVDIYGSENLMSVPLIVDKRRIGVFHIIDKRNGDWGETDLRCFLDISNDLGPLIEQLGISKQLQIEQKIRLRLLEKASQGAEEEQIVALLAELSQCPVLLYNQLLLCLAGSAPPDGNQSGLAGWKEAIATNTFLRRQIIEKTQNGSFYINPSKQLKELCPAWVVPIQSGLKFLGYLLILKDELVDFDPSLYQEWASIFALVLAHHCQLWDLKEKLSADFLDRLLNGQIKQEEALLWAARMDLDLRQKCVMLCASPDYSTENETASYEWLQRIPLICQYLRDELNKCFPGSWVGYLYYDLIILIPYSVANTSSLVKKIASTAQVLLQRVLKNISFTVGIGPACSGLADYSLAYSEVFRSVKVSRLLSGPGQVVESKSLSTYTLLYDVQRTTLTQSFVWDVLGPLLAYDEKHHTELVHILRVYLEEGGNYRQLAKEMHIHENTLRYRLKRIEEITGRSLDDARNRFDFQLALRMLSIADGFPWAFK